MREQPRLPEGEWPEKRLLKASNKTGWSYFENLVKTLHKELGLSGFPATLDAFERDKHKMTSRRIPSKSSDDEVRPCLPESAFYRNRNLGPPWGDEQVRACAEDLRVEIGAQW